MKIYEGERGLKGSLVTVNGTVLPQRRELHDFSRIGCEWGFEGPAPRQLALAILSDHLGNDAQALKLCEPFMRQVVAQLDNVWRMDSDEISRCLSEINAIR